MGRVTGNLIALSVTLGISLIAGELLLRPYVILPLKRVDPEVRYLPHPARRFTLKPSQIAYTYGAPVTIDERGFRNNSANPPDSGPVVFGLGDSFTFGMGVRNEETWPAQLEQRLTQRTGHAVRVVNGGTISYGAFQELDLFKSTGVATRPVVVVHGLYWNDFMNADPPRAGAPEVVTPDGYLSWNRPDDQSTVMRRIFSAISSRSALVYSVQQSVRQMRERGITRGRFIRRGGPVYAAAYPDFLERGVTADEWKPIEAFYREMKTLGAQQGFTVFSVIMPVSDIVDDAAPAQHVYAVEARRRLSELGIPYLDAFTLWQTRGLTRKGLFLPQGPDAHLNAKGYALVADALADELLTQPQTVTALSSASSRRP